MILVARSIVCVLQMCIKFLRVTYREKVDPCGSNRGYLHARCPLLGHGIPELITRLANCCCGRSVSWWHLESRSRRNVCDIGWLLAEKYSIVEK